VSNRNAPASWNWNSGASDGSTNDAAPPALPRPRDRASPCRDRDGPRARPLVQSPRRLLMRGGGRPRAGSPPATRSRTVPPAGPGAIGCPPVCPSPSLRARLWTRRERGRHPATATTAVRPCDPAGRRVFSIILVHDDVCSAAFSSALSRCWS